MVFSRLVMATQSDRICQAFAPGWVAEIEAQFFQQLAIGDAAVCFFLARGEGRGRGGERRGPGAPEKGPPSEKKAAADRPAVAPRAGTARPGEMARGPRGCGD